jgi:O-antigen ligase
VTLAEGRSWASRRTVTEWLALASGVAVFGYVGWDGALWDARYQFLLHAVGIGAIAGVVAIGLRGGALPRTRVDVPILALVAAFALATISAMNLGMSLRAMAVIVAFAAMLPVAVIAIERRPSWVGVVTSVPVLALSIPTLVGLVARRVEWVVVGAPGLPPIRLPAESTPFGSVAVPPFVIWPAWALAGLIGADRTRRIVQSSLVVVGVPLTVLSGSRSAWLAAGVTLLAVAIPWAWRRRGELAGLRRPNGRTLVLGLIVAVAAAALVVLLAPRLTAVTSLVYRTALWADTLRAWSSDPLLGIGPGFMPYARQAAAADYSFPVRQPHSHNLALGVLGDAGLIGLAAGVALVIAIAVVAGPWRARASTGRRAAYVLLGLGVGSLFEDISFLPGFGLLVICLLAVVLLDVDAVRWVRRPSGGRARALAIAAVPAVAALLAATAVADAGAVAYRAGVDAAGDGDWTAATTRLERAIAIDAWQPTGPKALAVAAERAGDDELATREARRAVDLNPGDATSWVNLAFLCATAGDDACRAEAAGRAAAMAGFMEAELINIALLDEEAGAATSADDAYRRSLLSQRATAFVAPWPRPVEIGSMVAPEGGATAELNALLARWSMGEPIDAGSIADPATRALAHAMLDEREAAEEWAARAVEASPAEIPTWDVVLVLDAHWGLPMDDHLAIAEVVRGGSVPAPDLQPSTPTLVYDIATFRAYPANGYVSDAIGLGTVPPYPWVLGTTLP